MPKPQRGFMTVSCGKLLKPINPAKAETLKRLYSVIGSMPVVLLGAFARDVVFEHVHGIEAPRGTMDIDTCVQMASWGDFKETCEQLKAIGFREDGPDHPEKMYDTNEQEVDLLPFGSLSEDGKSVVWPQDESQWTITGIQEAHDQAWRVQIDELELRVIPPCAMIYLKMFSVHDRPEARRKKDTGDVQFVLKNYLTVTGRDRLLSGGSDRDVMELAEGDLEVATARIAGRDIGNTLNNVSAKELAEILRIETVSNTYKPIAQELAGLCRGDFGRAREILTSLTSGFNEARG